MILADIVPWGRSLDEYRLMFALSEDDLRGRILGCGDGPASFNSELTARGGTVVSIDPLYTFPGAAIAQRVHETYDDIVGQVRQNAQRYAWDYFADPDALGRARLAVMERFLADYDAGRADGRYQAQSLPQLDFADGAFDLALCSHLLFLYSEQLSLEFHIAALAELLRVAQEVRVFPMLALDCRVSPHLVPASAALAARGFLAEQVAVPYEFQRGGDHMQRLRRPNCTAQL